VLLSILFSQGEREREPPAAPIVLPSNCHGNDTAAEFLLKAAICHSLLAPLPSFSLNHLIVRGIFNNSIFREISTVKCVFFLKIKESGLWLD